MVQSTSILALALSVLPWAIFGDSPRAQVNFYYDTNCRQYAGTSYTAGGPAVGGPYGAKSMLFATAPNCTELQNRNYGSALFFCKNPTCHLYDTTIAIEASTNRCQSFKDGVWALALCY